VVHGTTVKLILRLSITLASSLRSAELLEVNRGDIATTSWFRANKCHLPGVATELDVEMQVLYVELPDVSL
jgi:hypothetical protein